jgi:hypothetical protein
VILIAEEVEGVQDLLKAQEYVAAHVGVANGVGNFYLVVLREIAD